MISYFQKVLEFFRQVYSLVGRLPFTLLCVAAVIIFVALALTAHAVVLAFGGVFFGV